MYPKTKERRDATIKIQSIIKGCKARKHFKVLKEEFEKAKKCLLNKKSTSEIVDFSMIMTQLRATWKAQIEANKIKDKKMSEFDKQRIYQTHFENFLIDFKEKLRIEKQNPVNPNPLHKIILNQHGSFFSKGLISLFKPKFDEILDKPLILERKSSTPANLSTYKMPRFELRESATSTELQKLLKSTTQQEIHGNTSMISSMNKIESKLNLEE